jgi:molybdenum cofactor cytidylyltransferase
VIAGLLLAAGAGSRFGASKLVAPLREEPLVRHAARALAAASLDVVYVVLGNDARAVREALRGLDVRLVEHPHYLDGLGTSIAAGIGAVPADCEAVVIALGDQPSIATARFDALIEEWKSSGAPIVASRYRGESANPVLFAQAVFPELLGLRGDAGARRVVMADASRVRWLDVDEPVPIDVDVPDDLRRL